MLSSIERVIEEKIGSKTKNEQKFVFKRKGNETQFHVNYTVGEHLSAATSRLDSIMPENEENAYSLKRARDEIGDAMDALEHRNKMVKLADMSDSGWAVVNEYETHQLAADSDDERRMQKAEARAARKLKEAHLKKAKRPNFRSSV